MKKIVLSILVLGCLCGARFARAASPTILINEIMYDVKDLPDTDHEWVEIYNAGDVSVTLTGWKFADSSNHTLNAPPANGGQGSLTIASHDYAILSGNAATYLADHPWFTGTVIDTVMSLNNNGATLSILSNAGAVIDTVTYTSSQGGSGDGKTLSRFDAGFSPTNPTPGYQNENSMQSSPDDQPPVDDQPTTDPPPDTSNPSPDDQSSEAVNGSLPQQTGKIVSQKSKYLPTDVKIIVPSKLSTGVPVLFSAKVTGNFGENVYDGKFVWNFGNGEGMVRSDKSEFAYTYLYQGEYVVYLDYYRYAYQLKPEASVRKTIKIVASSVTVSLVSADGSIEIQNLGSQEIDLADWSLKQNENEFTFSNHTIVLPKSKIILPKTMIHFVLSPQPILLDPTGRIVSSGPNVPQGTVALPVHATVKSQSTPAQPLIAETGNISVTKSEKKEPDHSRTVLIFLGLGSVVFVAILATMFGRKKEESSLLVDSTKAIETVGDD